MHTTFRWFALSLLSGLVACSISPSKTLSPTPIMLLTVEVQSNIPTAFSASLAEASKSPASSTPVPGVVSVGANTPTAQVIESIAAVQMQAQDMRREGNSVKVSVCFEPPDDMDWGIDQAILRFVGGQAPMESAEWLELDSSIGLEEKSRRCEEIVFSVPEQADISNSILVVQRLRASLSEFDYCDTYLNAIQPTLEARQSGIQLECIPGDHSANLTVITRSDSLSQEEAERIVYDFYTMPGLWKFHFDNPPTFIIDSLPYQVSLRASNFRWEADSVKIDLCAQIDNSDWDAWQVVDGILQFQGREDRYFGTSTQLRRVSPEGAKIGKYCGTLQGFPNLGALPETAKTSDFSLTITSLIPDVEIGKVCSTYLEQVQSRLDEAGFGLQVQCGKTQQGHYALQVVDPPPAFGLSAAAFERVLGNVGLFLTVEGPWKIAFD